MKIISSIENILNLILPKSGNSRGALFMSLAAIIAAVMHSQVRSLSGEINIFEIAFFRNTIVFLLLVPLLFTQGKSAWKCNRPGLMFVRSVAGVGALLTYYFGLSQVPVADATALSFSVIIFSAIGAAIILNERVGIRRWGAIMLGLLGTIIILRPGIQVVSNGVLSILLSTILWAGAWLMVKILARDNSSVTIVFYSSLYFLILSLPFALWHWVWPTWAQFGELLLIGVMAALGMLCTTESLKLGEASAVMPFDFTRLIWAAAIGYLYFGEFPDIWTWIGGAIVFVSTFYITYREAVNRNEIN